MAHPEPRNREPDRPVNGRRPDRQADRPAQPVHGAFGPPMAVRRDPDGLPAGPPARTPSRVAIVCAGVGLFVLWSGTHIEPAIPLMLIGMGLVLYAARGWYTEDLWRLAQHQAWRYITRHEVEHNGRFFAASQARPVACALTPEVAYKTYRVDGLMRRDDDHWYRYFAQFDRDGVIQEGVAPLGTDEAKNLLRLSDSGLHARLFGHPQPGATK